MGRVAQVRLRRWGNLQRSCGWGMWVLWLNSMLREETRGEMTAEWSSPTLKVRGSAGATSESPQMLGCASPGPGRGRGPPGTPAIGCSLSPAFPDPFPEAPPTAPGARLESREGSGRRREERGEVPARAPLAARARIARSRRPRRHLFPLRPSVCRWLCLSAAPPLASPPPARPAATLCLPGPGPREPRPGQPELRPGPIVPRSVRPEAEPRDAERRGCG